MGLFDKIRQGLAKTREELARGIKGSLGVGKIDEALLESLEERLIRADVGLETSAELVRRLREKAWGRSYSDTAELLSWLSECVREWLGETSAFTFGPGLQVVVVVGVNGAGKTTTIGKLAKRFQAEGRQVLVGACDTFRAAAVDQLEEWCRRAEVPCIRQAQGADPAAVAFDAVAAAKSRGKDLVLLDTAGRLQNKADLMKELEKLLRVVGRHGEGLPQHVWLVLDGNTGQNAVSQAKLFGEVAPLTGLVITKIDGTARGGALLAMRQVTQAPALFLGMGEGVDDLLPFDAAAFAAGLFGP
jgi:fused signal recognition particle receptor